MNILTVRDAHGRVVHEQQVDPTETIQWTWTAGETVTLGAPFGWQLNGHRFDCRCSTCRPDIWRLP